MSAVRAAISNEQSSRAVSRALKPTCKLVRIRLKDLDAFLESGSSIGENA